MKFTDEDLEYIRMYISRENAIKLIKALSFSKSFLTFITQGVGKGLIEAYNIDIEHIADDSKM